MTEKRQLSDDDQEFVDDMAHSIANAIYVTILWNETSMSKEEAREEVNEWREEGMLP